MDISIETNKEIILFLKKNNLLQEDKNVIEADKRVFEIARFLKWAAYNMKAGRMSQSKYEDCLKYIKEYIDGKREIFWKNDSSVEFKPTTPKK